MKHSFTIVKEIRASASQVVANYLDLEHLPVHAGLTDCRVLSETERTACFAMTTHLGPFRRRTVHYFEFRPPAEFFHCVDSPLGPMHVVSTTRELGTGTPDLRSEVTVVTTVDLPRWAWPFRRLVERLLRHLNRVVLDEDLTILERRHVLFGDNIEDYLREQQVILFKEEFRRHWSKAAPAP